jgi:hypothetical protein
MVSHRGIKVNKEKIEAIQALQAPKNLASRKIDDHNCLQEVKNLKQAPQQ